MRTHRICSIPDCERPFYCRTWCKLHYDRWQKHGSTDLHIKAPRSCTVTGCTRPWKASGLCNNHYVRVMEKQRQSRRNVATATALSVSAIAEGWMLVPDFPDYEARADGAIRRRTWASGAKAGRTLRGRRSNGYMQVHLTNPTTGRRRNYLVHRLVAMAFLGKPPSNRHTVNHKNGLRDDNRVENLEWATFAENNLHAWRQLRSGKRAPSEPLAAPGDPLEGSERIRDRRIVGVDA